MNQKIKMKSSPSKFSVPPFATNEEIWNKILLILTPSERTKACLSNSEFNDPYMGGKEIIIRGIDHSEIAVALLSEVRKDEDEWAIYRES